MQTHAKEASLPNKDWVRLNPNLIIFVSIRIVIHENKSGCLVHHPIIGLDCVISSKKQYITIIIRYHFMHLT